MSSSGVILLNLENRNAAEFESISVPGSYDKALGAATAGSYITVYKWLYNGFAMTASLCTAENKTEYISLVDKTNGGELKVYSDDTVTLVGAVAPEPPDPPAPVMYSFPAYHIYSGSITDPYTMIVQEGHFVGTEFSTDWTPDDFVADGEPITVQASSYSARPYICEGVLAISYATGWFLTATQFAHEYSVGLSMWLYFSANTVLEQLDRDVSWSGKYYCADVGTPIVTESNSSDSNDDPGNSETPVDWTVGDDETYGD